MGGEKQKLFIRRSWVSNFIPWKFINNAKFFEYPYMDNALFIQLCIVIEINAQFNDFKKTLK